MKAEQRQSKRDLEEQRRRRLQTAHEKREALRRKAQRQRDELSEHHLITSSQELRQAMAMIEVEDSSTSQRRMKLTMLKTQINLRKKVLKQSIDSVHTVHESSGQWVIFLTWNLS